MHRQNWARRSVPGGNAVREYVPGGPSSYDANATVFRVGSAWDFELTAAPAEVPADIC